MCKQESLKSSWSEAKKSGDKHYLTGKPCSRGHVAKRFTKNGYCVDCNYIHQMRLAHNFAHLTDVEVLVLRGQTQKAKPQKHKYQKELDSVFS